MNVGQKVSALKNMTLTELRTEYAGVFGEPTRLAHKDALIRRIAWRLQANEEGGLPEQARRKALEIANDADLRIRSPRGGLRATGANLVPAGRVVTAHLDLPNDARLPMPGALLTRVYRGQTFRVRVLPKGFDYDGTVYRSLSAVAKAITGSHWNGYAFFGIEQPKRRETTKP